MEVGSHAATNQPLVSVDDATRWCIFRLVPIVFQLPDLTRLEVDSKLEAKDSNLVYPLTDHTDAAVSLHTMEIMTT